MKKIISVIKILLPGLLMLWMVIALQGGKDILAGLFIFFPILYILFGVAVSNKPELLLGMLLTTTAFLIPINLCYHMGSCIDCAAVYNLLCVIAFWIKRGIRKKRRRS